MVGCETGWVSDTKVPQQQSYELTGRKSVTHQEVLSRGRLCMCVCVCSGSRLRQCASIQATRVCMLVDLSVRGLETPTESVLTETACCCVGKYVEKEKIRIIYTRGPEINAGHPHDWSGDF